MADVCSLASGVVQRPDPAVRSERDRRQAVPLPPVTSGVSVRLAERYRGIRVRCVSLQDTQRAECDPFDGCVSTGESRDPAGSRRSRVPGDHDGLERPEFRPFGALQC